MINDLNGYRYPNIYQKQAFFGCQTALKLYQNIFTYVDAYH